MSVCTLSSTCFIQATALSLHKENKMLAAQISRPSRSAAGRAGAQRSVRVSAFKPINTQGLVAAVTAGSLLWAAPSFAVLPEGFSSPQGSNTAALEERLDELIEQRTGKAEALPELIDVPQVKETQASKPKEAPVVVAAPLAPAVAEPPAPVRAPAAAVEAPVAAPPKGLQVRPASSAAAPAAAAPSNGLLIGGGVAVLGAVAAVALAGGNNSGAEGQAAAAPAAAEAASAAAAGGPEGVEAAAAMGGVGESANPSSKAE